MGRIEVLLEFKGNRTIICCEHSRIPEKVEQQISQVLGEESPDVFVLGSSGRRSTTTPYYLLQRWVTKWKSYINVDSLEQIKSEDRITVVLANKAESVEVCSYSDDACMHYQIQLLHKHNIN